MRKTFFALALVVLLASPWLAASEERHSGTLISADLRTGTLVIEELIEATHGEAPRAMRRTVTVAPEARVALVERTPAGYVSFPMPLAEIQPGDFVTVVSTSGPTATSLDVFRSNQAPSASAR